MDDARAHSTHILRTFRRPVSHAVSSFYFTKRDVNTWEAEFKKNTVFDNYQSRYILNNHRGTYLDDDVDHECARGRTDGALTCDQR